MKLIDRPQYMDFLIRNKDLPIIKVITGVRRSGKSTLFTLYRQYLLAQGVPPERIIAINFEDLRYRNLLDYLSMYDYVTAHMKPGGKNYIFLDEVQHVAQFEKAVDSLFIQDNADVYITGSNAYFLSGDLATLLAGRYVEKQILPLSFQEYVQALEGSSLSLLQLYQQYVHDSAFPFMLHIVNHSESNVIEYLTGIYNTILVKDTLARLPNSDISLLQRIMTYLAANVGSLISPTKIAHTLTSEGRRTDNKTIERYLSGLRDSLLIYQADRYNVRGKNLLKINAKYYLVDPAFRRLLLSDTNADTGHILENVVYLELKRRGYDVYVGQLPDGEIDFVTKGIDGNISYYQVALSTLEPHVLDRELKPLLAVKDQYPKYLLTLDEITPEANYNGIRKLNVLNWLIGKK